MATDTLPFYVVINPQGEKEEVLKRPNVLRNPAQAVQFPLDTDSKQILKELEAKFDQEENCAGLAAPQIGYGLRAIILAVAADEELKKWRLDLSDTLAKSLWLNPTWRPLTVDKTIDWEGCFSVEEWVARIPRFRRIAYEAWTPAGEKISGEAQGFLARLIQHEIDHLEGKLWIDYVDQANWVARAELRKAREKN